jgi:putative ABC transport system permease protein
LQFAICDLQLKETGRSRRNPQIANRKSQIPMSLKRLVTSNLSTRKVRTGLTVAAIALSVSLVVAVTSGYKSVEGAAYNFLVAYMGSTDVQVTHKNDARQGVDESLVARMRQDPAVERAYGRLETDTGMLDAQGKPVPSRSAQLIGVDRPADDDIQRTPITAGRWFDGSSGDVAVIDQQAAEILKLKVGDDLLVPGLGGTRTVKVVGICHKPAIMADRVSWYYLPLHTVQALTRRPGQVTRVMIDLRRVDDDQAFAARWEPTIRGISPDLKIRLARDTRKEMDRQLSALRFMSFVAGAASVIVAAFIVFTTLSMGVTERQRTLAMLRAIGAYRGQVARLVVSEGVLLGLAGAVIGVPLGLRWTFVLTTWKADFFTAGMAVDPVGIALGIGFSCLAALGASVVPAWSASRVSPLEAMTPLARAVSFRGPLLAAALGVVCLAIDPVMLNWPGVSRDVLFYAHFFAGLPGLFVGFFLVAPVVVWVVEKGLGRVVPVLMGVRPSLLRQQLTGSGIWRAAGTGSSLMTGLAILVGLQTVGHSILKSWRLPDRFPDIFIYAGQGLTKEQWSGLDGIGGIRKGQVMPIAWAFPGLPQGIFGAIGLAVLPEATMFLGVEPDRALEMMDLEFRDGNARDAAAGLKKGDHVIVTEEFRVLKGLRVGDKLPLMTNQGWRDFTICGVIWSPGIDVMVQMFDMGKMFDQRTAASVFGSIDDVSKYFGQDRAFLFAANLELGVDKEVMLKQVKERLGERGWKAGDVRHIKAEIMKGFEKLLLLMSTMAFAAMAVAALGVTKTVMATVHSRQWQFGILRAIGVTRGQLMRLVLAEAVLLGVVGCALGLAAGFLMSFIAVGVSRFAIGYLFELRPPWGMIGLGSGIIMAVAVAASLWPAASAARAEPLQLLQSGRAAV